MKFKCGDEVTVYSEGPDREGTSFEGRIIARACRWQPSDKVAFGFDVPLDQETYSYDVEDNDGEIWECNEHELQLTNPRLKMVEDDPFDQLLDELHEKDEVIVDPNLQRSREPIILEPIVLTPTMDLGRSLGEQLAEVENKYNAEIRELKRNRWREKSKRRPISQVAPSRTLLERLRAPQSSLMVFGSLGVTLATIILIVHYYL